MNYLYVALGGAVGSMLRLLVRQVILPFAPINGYFYATMAVNIVGSFIIGLLFPVFEKTTGLNSMAWLFLTTGVLGGFTTFSAFSLDTLIIYGRSGLVIAGGYVMATLAFGLIGVFMGAAVGRVIV